MPEGKQKPRRILAVTTVAIILVVITVAVKE
jgi:hypothetical protein